MNWKIQDGCGRKQEGYQHQNGAKNRKFDLIVICSILACTVSTVDGGLFFPEDLQTALNVAYSRIPAVRSGIDSRLGVGFRIGPNADIQLQWELGPRDNLLPSPKREALYVQKGKKKLQKQTTTTSSEELLTSDLPETTMPPPTTTEAAVKTTRDPDYGVKRLRKTLLSLFADP